LGKRRIMVGRNKTIRVGRGRGRKRVSKNNALGCLVVFMIPILILLSSAGVLLI